MKQWDTFFYYGKGSVQDENEQDLLQLVQQPEKSLYYNRGYGCDAKYNFPVSAVNQSLVAYSIALSVATRNQTVSDGENGTPDRRIATSQSTITISDGSQGERDIYILYFNYSDTQTPKQTSVRLA